MGWSLYFQNKVGERGGPGPVRGAAVAFSMASASSAQTQAAECHHRAIGVQ